MSPTLMTASRHQAFSDTNPAPPTLFTLPPELRERIFQYVLGNHTLHVSRKGNFGHGTAYCFPCQNEEFEKRISLIATQDTGLAASPPTQSFLIRHSTCETVYHLHHPRLPLDILLTCKQAYSDGSLLPFTGNTFLFADMHPRDALICFLRRLTREQAGAIRRIVTVSFRTQYGPAEPMPSPDFITERLSGLRALTYAIECEGYYPNSAREFFHGSCRVRERFERDIIIFGGLPGLREVRVRVGCTKRTAEGLWREGVSEAMFQAVGREWAVGLEEKLLEGRREADRQRL